MISEFFGEDSSAVIAGASEGNTVRKVILQSVVYAAGLFLLRKKKVEPLLKKTETEAV